MTIPNPAATRAPDHRLAGIAYRCGAVLCFGIMALALKLGAARGVALPMLIFSRSALSIPVVVAWLALGPGLSTIKTKRPMAHIIRSTLGTGGMTFLALSLMLLPIAQATAINFTAPVFATLLSAIVLGEPVGPRRWLALALGITGVFVIARPFSEGSISHVGLLVALLGATFAGAVSVTVRQIGRTETVGATVFWFMVATGASSAIFLPFAPLPRDPVTWAILALAGLGGGLGQICMTNSLRKAPVSVVVPFDYLQILLALAFGYAIWGDQPTLSMIGGAAMIMGGGLYTAWREHRVNNEKIPATPPDA